MDSLGVSLIAGFAVGATVMVGEGLVNIVKLGVGWEPEEYRREIAKREIYVRVGLGLLFVIFALIYYKLVY